MICHVDMDAFFASIEQMDNPLLAGRCVVVGGVTDRGVVSAASYEARKYGVRSAMPMYRARQLCPGGVFLFPRKQRYRQVSESVMAVLKDFSPVVEPVSIDEAFLDLSGCEKLFGAYEQTGKEIKKQIRQTVGLNCSVGIAPVRFLAKIASDRSKPDGLQVIMHEAVRDVLDTLPVARVPGVGPVTVKTLGRIGIRFLGEIRGLDEQYLVGRLGRFGRRLRELSMGVDRQGVAPVRPVKSISSEETLQVDTTDASVLEALLLKHAEDVGRQLRAKKLFAKTVFIKLKDSSFRQTTRQAPLPEPSQSSERIYRAGRELLRAYSLEKPIRLAGLGASELVDADRPVQQSLFGETAADTDKKWEQLGQTVDAISDRFGPDAIRKARLCE